MKDFGGVLMRLAEHGLETQKARQGDYYRDDILVCGRCGKDRQGFKDIDGRKVKVAIMCDCDLSAEAMRKAEERRKAHEQEVAERKARSLIESRYINANFSNYTINPDNKIAFGVAKKYVDNFETMEKNKQGLLFYGSVGTGKSHTAACIANELMERGVSVVMTTFANILSEVQSDFNCESRIMEKVMNARLVIFDDFGVERRTQFALEKIYNILDARYKTGKPMILTTNLPLQEMQEEMDINYKRLYDRIFEVCYPVKMDGENWRMQEGRRRHKVMKELLEA